MKTRIMKTFELGITRLYFEANNWITRIEFGKLTKLISREDLLQTIYRLYKNHMSLMESYQFSMKYVYVTGGLV